jgi:hypothetical protein
MGRLIALQVGVPADLSSIVQAAHRAQETTESPEAPEAAVLKVDLKILPRRVRVAKKAIHSHIIHCTKWIRQWPLRCGALVEAAGIHRLASRNCLASFGLVQKSLLTSSSRIISCPVQPETI